MLTKLLDWVQPDTSQLADAAGGDLTKREAGELQAKLQRMAELQQLREAA